MSAQQINRRVQPIGVGTESRALWGRRLAFTAAVVFILSSAFPVAAGLSKDTASFPDWWGAADVVVAAVLALLALAIHGFAQGKVDRRAEDASYRAYRVLTHGIFAMIVVFFVLGDRIVWSNCLPGFAWRTWLLLYSLPAWLTVSRTAAATT
jgi:hypothetical protein